MAEEKSIGIGLKVKRCGRSGGGPRRSESQIERASDNKEVGSLLAMIVADYFIYNIATLTFKHFPSVICQGRTCEGRDKSTEKRLFQIIVFKILDRKNHLQTVLRPSSQLGLSLAAEAIFFLSFDCYPNYPGW